MPYTIGKPTSRPDFSKPIFIIDSKSIITGCRAFAREEKSGRYFEIHDLTQESLWVQGENQGAFAEGPFETRDAAIAAASNAYRHLNRNQRKAA